MEINGGKLSQISNQLKQQSQQNKLRKVYDKNSNSKLIKQLKLETTLSKQSSQRLQSQKSVSRKSIFTVTGQEVRHPMINEFIAKEEASHPLLMQRPSQRSISRKRMQTQAMNVQPYIQQNGSLVNFYKQIELANQEFAASYNQNLSMRASLTDYSMGFKPFNQQSESSLCSFNKNIPQLKGERFRKGSRPTTASSVHLPQTLLDTQQKRINALLSQQTGNSFQIETISALQRQESQFPETTQLLQHSEEGNASKIELLQNRQTSQQTANLIKFQQLKQERPKSAAHFERVKHFQRQNSISLANYKYNSINNSNFDQSQEIQQQEQEENEDNKEQQEGVFEIVDDKQATKFLKAQEKVIKPRQKISVPKMPPNILQGLQKKNKSTLQTSIGTVALNHQNPIQEQIQQNLDYQEIPQTQKMKDQSIQYSEQSYSGQQELKQTAKLSQPDTSNEDLKEVFESPEEKEMIFKDNNHQPFILFQGADCQQQQPLQQHQKQSKTEADFEIINEEINQIAMFENNLNLTQSQDTNIQTNQSFKVFKNRNSSKDYQQMNEISFNPYQQHANTSLPSNQNSERKKHQYLPSKKYIYLTQRLDRLKDMVEDIRYRDYLKKVEILNQKKAFLSTYRFILTKDEKITLIKEINEREKAIESEEFVMFAKE